MNNSPIISVVMSVYNSEKYLSESIESILSQTFSDFEFIIIDDGSTDKSNSILNKFARSDARINIITNLENIGLANSLNKGLHIAKGDYVARMDSDDISYPKRFEIQIEFMKNNKAYGVVGGNIDIIDEKSNYVKTLSFPKTHNQILWYLCFQNPIAHPTTMIKSNLLRKVNGYKNYISSQDYDLWQRLSNITKLFNVDQSLLKYRVHGSNISFRIDESRTARRNEFQNNAVLQIIGSENKPNDYVFGSDKYFDSLIIKKCFKKIRNGLNKFEIDDIRKDAATRILKNANMLKSDNFIQKLHLYLSAIALNPKLINKFIRKIIS